MIYRMGAPDPHWCRHCKGKGCERCNWTGIQAQPFWLIPISIGCAIFWAVVLYNLL